MVVAYLGDRCYYYLFSFVMGVAWIGLVFCLFVCFFNPIHGYVGLLLHKITSQTTKIIYITIGLLYYLLALVQGLAVPGSSESLLLLAAILAGIIILSLRKVPLLYLKMDIFYRVL